MISMKQKPMQDNGIKVKTTLACLAVAAAAAIFSAGASSGTAFKCSDCHDAVKNVLPKGHAQTDGFGSCFTCHKTDGKAPRMGRLIHDRHLSASGITEADCFGCHVLNSDSTITINVAEGITLDKDSVAATAEKFRTYYEPGKLANSHNNAGEYCLSCHKNFDAEDIDEAPSKCIECHGNYSEMAKKTEKTGQSINPHKHHFPTLVCTKCHQPHEDFKDYCVKCHQWNFTWKQKIK